MRSKQGLIFIFAIKIAYIIDNANYIEIIHLIDLLGLAALAPRML